MLAGCPNIDPMTLINGIVSASNIRYIRLPDVNITAPSSILSALKNSGSHRPWTHQVRLMKKAVNARHYRALDNV